MIGFKNEIQEENARTIYYLLYAYYGNSHISSLDEHKFKYKLFAIIYMYAPSWVKRFTIQEELRKLSIEDLRDGAKMISNHAVNPTEEPGTGATGELPYVSDQSVSKSKSSYATAYNNIMVLLRTDVTKEFIDLFKKLFVTIVAPPPILGYMSGDCSEYEYDDGNTNMIDESNGMLLGGYFDSFQTRTFTEIYPSEEEFLADWREQ